MEGKKLSELATGDTGVVTGLAPSALAPKLAEMGLLRGRKVTLLFRAPFNGPVAVDVEGYLLSLRTEEADMVQVETNVFEN